MRIDFNDGIRVSPDKIDEFHASGWDQRVFRKGYHGAERNPDGTTKPSHECSNTERGKVLDRAADKHCQTVDEARAEGRRWNRRWPGDAPRSVWVPDYIGQWAEDIAERWMDEEFQRTGREVRITTLQVFDRLLGPLVAAGRLVTYDGLSLTDLVTMIESLGQILRQEAPPERKDTPIPGPPHPMGRPTYRRESA